jgi:hypothetical protein
MRVPDVVQMRSTRGLLRSLEVVAALLGLASLSCSDRMDLATRPTAATEPTSVSTTTALPDPNTQPGYYPLTTGNRWTYQDDVAVQRFPDSAGSLPPPEQFQSEVLVEITPPATIDGRDYLGEVTTITTPGSVSVQYYRPLRQDATGLYEWSPARVGFAQRVTRPVPGPSPHTARIAVPAGRSAAVHAAYEQAARRLEERVAAVEASIGRGAAAFRMTVPPTTGPAEIIRLRYPLEIKSQWRIRNDRRFTASAVVVGQEALDLPSGRLLGWRLEVDSDALGPRDYMRLWYGTAGFLQQVAHLEVDAVDQTGSVIGTYTWDERQQLTEYQLAPPSSTHPSPAWPPRRPK